MWDQNENYDLDTSVSYKKDNPLLELTLNFQISFERLGESCPHITQAFTTVNLNETTTTIHNRL